MTHGQVWPDPQQLSTDQLPAQHIRRIRTKKRVWLVVGATAVAVLLAVGGVLGYGYYQGRIATNKFNALTLQIKNQELAVARRNAQGTTFVGEITTAIATNGSTASATLNASANKLATLAGQSCMAGKSAATSATIDQQMKGLRLNALQRRYVSDIKQVLDATKDSSYDDKTLCRDGQLLAALARNYAFLSPGLQVISNLSANPTAAQMDSLKTYATTEPLIDQAALQAATPKTAAFFNDAQQLLSDMYLMFQAAGNGDTASAAQYVSKVTTLGAQIDGDTTAMDAEISNLSKQESTAAIKASQLEIAAIDYQRSHNVTNADMQLDYALPVFRIADATIGNYSDAHDGSYPYGSSGADLVSASPINMKSLQTRGLLKGMRYQSLGSDQSGFSLSITLSDGSVLSEQLNPATALSA